MNKVLSVAIFFLLIACEEKSQFEDLNIDNKISLNRNHSLDIPKSLRKKIDDTFFELSLRPVERTETQKKVALKNVTRNFLNFEVFLLDKSDVLQKSAYMFRVDGGGHIDFNEYLKPGAQGDFLLGFRFGEEYNAENMRVFFLPNLKSKGCDHFLDISDHFFSKIQKQGILSTTRDFTYIKLLSGAYVFISNIDDRYYLGQVYVSDAKAKKLMCE